MRALIQRVKRASVTLAGEPRPKAKIAQGLLIFLGVHADDGDAEIDWMAKKAAALRIFEDDKGKMNLSLKDIDGEALVISQFTLYGDSTKGNRPSFVKAAPPAHAEPTYERFSDVLSEILGKPVGTGQFAADMQVDLLNDGPVTLWLER